MKKTLLLFVVFTTTNVIILAQTTFIKGTVIDKYLQKRVHNAELILNLRVKENPTDEFRNQNIRIDSFVTDSSGKFSFQIKDTGLYYLQIFAQLDPKDYDTVYFEKDTLVSKHASESQLIEVPKMIKIEYLNIQMTIYCPYNETRNMKVCPNCQKPDKICNIIYGLPNFPYDEKGKLKEPIPCKLGGCVVRQCHPKNYCNRCNLEF